MPYCIDSSAFIEAAQKLFRFEITPGYWRQLLVQAQAGEVFSIEEVYKELQGGNDTLVDWARNNHALLFKRNDDPATANRLVGDVEAALRERSPPYTAQAKADFLACADPWLLAYCSAHDAVLVTEEVEEPAKTTVVKIPDIARVIDVQTMTLHEMTIALGIQLT